MLCLNAPSSWQYEFRYVHIDNMWTHYDGAWHPHGVIDKGEAEDPKQWIGRTDRKIQVTHWSSKLEEIYRPFSRNLWSMPRIVDETWKVTTCNRAVRVGSNRMDWGQPDTDSPPTLITVAGHQWTVSTNTGCNQWLSLAKPCLKVLPGGRNRSPVARTSKVSVGGLWCKGERECTMMDKHVRWRSAMLFCLGVQARGWGGGMSLQINGNASEPKALSPVHHLLGLSTSDSEMSLRIQPLNQSVSLPWPLLVCASCCSLMHPSGDLTSRPHTTRSPCPGLQ